MSEEPMTPLDLTDGRVRAMADRNHVPQETWALNGNLISLSCAECGHQWPCGTRRALDAFDPVSDLDAALRARARRGGPR